MSLEKIAYSPRALALGFCDPKDEKSLSSRCEGRLVKILNVTNALSWIPVLHIISTIVAICLLAKKKSESAKKMENARIYSNDQLDPETCTKAAFTRTIPLSDEEKLTIISLTDEEFKEEIKRLREEIKKLAPEQENKARQFYNSALSIQIARLFLSTLMIFPDMFINAARKIGNKTA